MAADPDRPHGMNLRRGRVSLPGQIYHITTVTLGREPVFSDLRNARFLINTLHQSQVRDEASTLAFVVMPDHLHWLMQLGEVIFGGVGSGLYGMLIFVVLAVFLAGLMVGKTPEYLGKKIEAYDVKAGVLFVTAAAFSILGFTAWAAVSEWGLAGLNNAGPHGFSEMMYAFSSGTGNNGSAFAGLSANTTWYNTTIAIAMLIGRFIMIIPALALAGNLAKKKRVALTGGSFPVSGPLFSALLVGTVLIVGALTFFPALSLGPIVEHFLMTGSEIIY